MLDQTLHILFSFYYNFIVNLIHSLAEKLFKISFADDTV